MTDIIERAYAQSEQILAAQIKNAATHTTPQRHQRMRGLWQANRRQTQTSLAPRLAVYCVPTEL